MKARKGDLCAVEKVTRDYVIGQESRERTTVTLAVVGSTTRDGVIRTVRPIYGAEGPSETAHGLMLGERTYAIPRDAIDAGAAVAAYSVRRYPTAPHSTMAPPCGSLDELRDLLRPFRVELAS